MGIIKDTAYQVYADGPSSSPDEPYKPEIRQLFQTVDNVIAGVSVGYDVSYETRAQLYADLNWPAGATARVFGDSNSAYIGVYKKSGASGAGSWTRVGDLPGGDTSALQSAVDDLEVNKADVTAVEAVADDVTALQTSKADVTALNAVAAAKTDKTTQVTGGGIATGGGALSGNVTITVTEATAEEAAAGTDGTKAMTPRRATSHFNQRTNTFTRRLLTDPTTTNTTRRFLEQPALSFRAPYEDFDDVEEVVQVDRSNRVFLSFAKDGTIAAKGLSDGGGGGDGTDTEVPHLGEEPYIEAGVLKVIGPAGPETLADATGEGWDFVRGACEVSGAVQTAWERPSIGTETSVRVGRGGDLIVPSSSRLLIVIPTYGQSLSVGAQGVPLLSTTLTATHPDSILMFAGAGIDVRMGLDAQSTTVTALDPNTLTGFQPLVSAQNGTRGVTLAEGMGYHLAEKLEDGVHFVPKHLFFTAGWGGKTYSQIMKGTQPYLNLLAALTKAKALAEAQGWQLWVPCIAFEHGQSDASNAAYQANIETLQADLEADIKAIFGQVGDIPFILTQPSSFFAGATNATLGIYNAVKAAPNKFIPVGPEYHLPFATDLLHLNNVGNLKIGEYFAKPYISDVCGVPSWKALRPSGIVWNGSTQIDITFHVPVGNLVLDTTGVSDPGNYGFKVVDDNGDIAISSVSVLDGDTIRIITGTTPGAVRKVRYALDGYAEPDRIAGAGPRGCLRDQDTTPSIYDGEPLYNACMHFEEAFA